MCAYKYCVFLHLLCLVLYRRLPNHDVNKRTIPQCENVTHETTWKYITSYESVCI